MGGGSSAILVCDGLWKGAQMSANSRGKKQVVTERRLPITFIVPEQLPVIFANHMLVSHTEDEFFLTFFQLTPPVLIEGGQLKFEDIKGAEAKAVARISISASRMNAFIEAQKRNLETWKKHKRGKA